MKDFVLETLGTKVTNLTQDEILQQIQWCFTVPAIWEEISKQEMENAAIRAGMISGAYAPNASLHPLIIVLEPEAVSLFLTHQDAFNNYIQINEPYMILDCGGGTTDIAVHSFKKDSVGKVSIIIEAIRSTGGVFGSINIDSAFYGLAQRKIPGLFGEFLQQDPESFNAFMNHWEHAKRAYNGDDDSSLVIELPSTLRLFWKNQLEQSEDGVTDIDESTLTLSLNSTEAKEIFEKITSSIADLVLKQQKKVHDTIGTSPNLIAVVGGLSESPYIRQHLQIKITDRFDKIVFPPNAGGAVANGATLQGLNPTSFVPSVQVATAVLINPGLKAIESIQNMYTITAPTPPHTTPQTPPPLLNVSSTGEERDTVTPTREATIAASINLKRAALKTWEVDDVCTWLKTKKAPTAVVDAFTENGVTGQMIINGITDEDLRDMGINRLQRKSIAAMLMNLGEAKEDVVSEALENS